MPSPFSTSNWKTKAGNVTNPCPSRANPLSRIRQIELSCHARALGLGTVERLGIRKRSGSIATRALHARGRLPGSFIRLGHTFDHWPARRAVAGAAGNDVWIRTERLN